MLDQGGHEPHNRNSHNSDHESKHKVKFNISEEDADDAEGGGVGTVLTGD